MTEQAKWQNWDQVPLVLGLQEVADLLRVHPNTAKKLCQTGKLPAVKVGRAWRVQRKAVKAMLADTYEPPKVLASSVDIIEGQGDFCGGVL